MKPVLDSTDDIDLSRRNFLKLGLAGSVALGTVSLTANLAGCARREQAAAKGYMFLRDADVVLFRALTPAVLAGALPQEPAERADLLEKTVRGVDGACYLVGPPAQAQLYQLFDLLNLGLTRALTTGVFAAWDSAETADVTEFLQRWHDSSVGMFNAGHRALVKLVAGGFYGTPAGWKVAGYPGPLAWVYQAVNS